MKANKHIHSKTHFVTLSDMEQERLYMMALTPPQELTLKIEKIRQEFAAAYQCKAALKPPVHITLYPPYKEHTNHELEVKSSLSRWCAQQKNFILRINGFDAFRKNGVLFINVEKNESLKELHKGFTTQMTRLLQPSLKNNQAYHPHITIGYRDIPKDVFEEALRDYLPRKFEADFPVEAVHFWRHNGQRWETIDSFPLLKEENSIRQAALF